MALIRRQAAQLAERPPDLRALVRRKPLHRLIPSQEVLPPLRIHRIQLCQAIPIALLCLRRQLVKTRLLIQGLFLLLQAQVAVLTQPARKMLPAWPTESMAPARLSRGDGRRDAGLGTPTRGTTLNRRRGLLPQDNCGGRRRGRQAADQKKRRAKATAKPNPVTYSAA